MGREELIICFQDTFEKSNSGNLRQRTERAIASNRVYKENFTSEVKHRTESASVEVYSGTTFDIAKRYCSLGRTGVLNFANPENAGGGVELGAMAQEECLCRSSNLFACISNRNVFDEYYGYHRKKDHFYSDRLIYTKDVTVFKDDSIVPQMLPETEWFDVDVITCAAPYIARRKHTNSAALLDLFKSRVRNIFEAARDNNVDYLILGAFGCGAFKNPPLVVAEAFRQTIEEEGYLKDFKQIVFAIKPTGENCPNLRNFRLRFNNYANDTGMAVTLDEFLWKWQLRKQFSVLGDSISTLDGYNPRGYKVFYADNNSVKSGVIKAGDTWWDKVIGYFDGELLVNNSWSGSRVTKLPEAECLFPSGCSDERTGALHINDVKPDVILVYLGTNDWAFGAPIRECWNNSEKYENWLGTIALPDERCFDVAYDSMLKKIKINYPNAEIWCCTLCETYMSENPDFKFPHKYAGAHIEEYNDIIRKSAESHGCRLIDLYQYKMPYDTIDGTHPNNAGMNTIATMMIQSMSGPKTTILDSDTLRLTLESSGRTVQFQKNRVEVGRDSKCDLVLLGKPAISRHHAAFLYEDNKWFLCDNFSCNGTWLNGMKIQSGRLYQLTSNDEINFAMAEKVIYEKQGGSTQPTGDSDAKALAFLEAGMHTFARSEYKDEFALKCIIIALSDAPLYFPVEIDLEAMLGSADPTKLKAGDTIQPDKDVKMRILTLKPESGAEFVPMFTSKDEADKGPAVSFIRYYPKDYLPKLIQMDKPVVINPFSDNRFVLSKQLIKEVLLLLVENRTKSGQ